MDLQKLLFVLVLFEMSANVNEKVVILVEEIDSSYCPSESDIIEQGKYLKIDIIEDDDLLWIARESLLAPLPEDWKPCKQHGGSNLVELENQFDDEIYYFNFKTGASQWEHPCDIYYLEQVQIHKKRKEIRKKVVF